MNPRKRRLLRWAAIAATVPAVGLVLFIAYFVASAEIAHDEDRCPFAVVERRELASALVVIDESRRCQSGVEEHRWVVERAAGRREIGRRRLHQPLYEEGSYSWRAFLEEGFVHIDIVNEGVENAAFREGPE